MKPETFSSIFDKQAKTIPVCVDEADVLPCIPTQDYRITCARIMGERFTCDAYTIPLTCNVAILDPEPIKIVLHLDRHRWQICCA
jgi:hypothetical protein